MSATSLDEALLVGALVEAIERASVSLPTDVTAALAEARSHEQDEIARGQLATILANIDCAHGSGLPLCQDTGTPTFFVDAGTRSPYLPILRGAIGKAVAQATRQIPLRPNAVDPLTGRNSGNNVGRHVPIIDWELTGGDDVLIHYLPKGGGSENACGLYMLTPNEGLPRAEAVIVEHLRETAPRACPPVVVGVGIGGSADLALRLAKRSLLRPIGTPHPMEAVAAMEARLTAAVNETGIGPMGLGGHTTALAVHVDIADRHPASFPVGIVVQCWADRRSSVRIRATGDLEVGP